MDAGERRRHAGGGRRDAQLAETAGADAGPPMSRPPALHLIEGGLEREQGLYRLRAPRQRHAPAEEVWPKTGEWLALVRRLVRNPKPG